MMMGCSNIFKYRRDALFSGNIEFSLCRCCLYIFCNYLILLHSRDVPKFYLRKKKTHKNDSHQTSVWSYVYINDNLKNMRLKDFGGFFLGFFVILFYFFSFLLALVCYVFFHFFIVFFFFFFFFFLIFHFLFLFFFFLIVIILLFLSSYPVSFLSFFLSFIPVIFQQNRNLSFKRKHILYKISNTVDFFLRSNSKHVTIPIFEHRKQSEYWDGQVLANAGVPDQTAPRGEVCLGSTLLAITFASF